VHTEECKDRGTYVQGMKKEEANGRKLCKKTENARDENAAPVR
jgi:hypothetical protein